MHTLNATENEFKFSEISEEFVLNEIQNLDVRKAVGVDGLNLRLLKTAASSSQSRSQFYSIDQLAQGNCLTNLKLRK